MEFVHKRKIDSGFVKDLNFASHFPDINLENIGKRIGGGMGHHIYEYGPDLVIKIPWKKPLWPKSTVQRRLFDISIMQDYLPEYVPETTLITNDTDNYCFLQRRILNFEHLSPRNIHDVHESFLELVERNRILVQELELSVDFFGKDGMVQSLKSRFNQSIIPEMTNIIVESTEYGPQLLIVDISMLRMGEHYHPKTTQGKRSYRLANFVYSANRDLALRHFGVDIGYSNTKSL